MGSIEVGGFLQPPYMSPLQPGGHQLVVEGDSGFGLPGPLKSERSAGHLVKFLAGAGLS